MFCTESHCTLWTFVEFFLSQVFKCFLDALNQIKVLYNINIANGKISRQFEFSNESLEFHFEKMIWNTLYSCGLCEFLCVSLVLWGSRMFLNKLNSWKACFLCDPECGSLKFGHYLGIYYKLDMCEIILSRFQQDFLCELSYGISDWLVE